MHTPTDERHVLLDAERESFERAVARNSVPAAWIPLPDSAGIAWIGPGLTAARLDDAQRIELLERDDARRFLLVRAFAPPDGDRARADAHAGAPGTPIPRVIESLRFAYPEWFLVDNSPTGALFFKLPHAVLACDGKYGKLDYVFWHTGEVAMELIFQYGLSRTPVLFARPNPPHTASRSERSERTERSETAEGANADVAVATPGETRLRHFPIAWTDGQRLRAGILMIVLGLLASPVLAAPLLLAGPIAWFIGILCLWVVTIPLGRAQLRKLERKSRRPLISFDGTCLRVPVAEKVITMSLPETRLEHTWQKSVYASAQNGGIRPAVARLRLVGPDQELLLIAIELPQLPGFELATRCQEIEQTTIVELLPQDFVELVRTLDKATTLSAG